ncbi:MAG: hypothetical protein N2595_04615, partial [bacterium]|nr:hypothetical protein [bacterium]
TGNPTLPSSGGLALYPFEPATIWPSSNFEHVCTKILDYVAWGSEDAAPPPHHPAVQAGLWQPYGLVSTSNTHPSGRIALKSPGRNDYGALSWQNGIIIPEPALSLLISAAPALVLRYRTTRPHSLFSMSRFRIPKKRGHAHRVPSQLHP